MHPEITIIPYGSTAYQQLLALRDSELRVPLNLTFTPEELAKDVNDTHIAALAEGNVIGGLIVTKHEDGYGQLRQMVVARGLQRSGLGMRLVQFAEAYIHGQGISRIELNARVNAQIFYEKAGYEVIGTGFTQATLPHVRMLKQLR